MNRIKMTVITGLASFAMSACGGGGGGNNDGTGNAGGSAGPAVTSDAFVAEVAKVIAAPNADQSEGRETANVVATENDGAEAESVPAL
ncbi:MAG: hypothetical protein ACKVQU_33215 [Burkholderiales bacterium]